MASGLEDVHASAKIIYEFRDDGHLIAVVKIGDRKAAYR
jgi:mRNA-degrading endonuclease RelE of RelBE toxin-antitoxin system